MSNVMDKTQTDLSKFCSVIYKLKRGAYMKSVKDDIKRAKK
jgi:hypothetical protein